MSFSLFRCIEPDQTFTAGLTTRVARVPILSSETDGVVVLAATCDLHERYPRRFVPRLALERYRRDIETGAWELQCQDGSICASCGECLMLNMLESHLESHGICL